MALAVALASGCGSAVHGLGDGAWYGKLVRVDVAGRRLTFAPACKLSKVRRWANVDAERRNVVTVKVAPHPDLAIYYRPGGDVAAGHGQPVDLKQLAGVVAGGPDRDFPAGWFVDVRGGAAAGVEESSGLTSSGAADRRTFACVWSRRTRTFVASAVDAG